MYMHMFSLPYTQTHQGPAPPKARPGHRNWPIGMARPVRAGPYDRAGTEPVIVIEDSRF